MSEMNKRLNVEIGVTKKNKEDWIKVTTVVGGDTPEELDESIKAVQSRFKKLVALSLEMYEMMPAMEATPASPKQIEFIKSLRSNVNISYLGEADLKRASALQKKLKNGSLTREEASEYIEIMKAASGGGNNYGQKKYTKRQKK
ncbi:hypothetical protein [Pseudothermotoga sp.]|uniref:hypothetical protein n=1 Tax=Pseudothermotoga sp. TaxID=2033661 RepID=UPI000E9C1149|nr:hypothetical protein [Pseudothermotoga sp.]HBJ81577.1 hypothetical protein [Pseudothermotoga sp.]